MPKAWTPPHPPLNKFRLPQKVDTNCLNSDVYGYFDIRDPRMKVTLKSPCRPLGRSRWRSLKVHFVGHFGDHMGGHMGDDMGGDMGDHMGGHLPRTQATCSFTALVMSRWHLVTIWTCSRWMMRYQGTFLNPGRVLQGLRTKDEQ